MFMKLLFAGLYLRGQCFTFLVRTEQHVKKECYQSDCNDECDHIAVSCEHHTKLIYDECDHISEYALISDCEPGLLGAVHLTLHSTDCCEAGST